MFLETFRRVVRNNQIDIGHNESCDKKNCSCKVLNDELFNLSCYLALIDVNIKKFI